MIFLNYFGKKNLKEGGDVILGVMAEKKKEEGKGLEFSNDVFDEVARKEQPMQLGVQDKSMDEWSPPTLDFPESSATENKGGYGKRPDGSEKDVGWLGELKLGEGGVATEDSKQSDAVTVDGKRIDFPTLVPSLTDAERSEMVNNVIPKGGDVPENIMRKAIDHANMRLEKGKGVFFDSKTDNKENEDVALEMETRDIIKKVLSRGKEQP